MSHCRMAERNTSAPGLKPTECPKRKAQVPVVVIASNHSIFALTPKKGLLVCDHPKKYGKMESGVLEMFDMLAILSNLVLKHTNYKRFKNNWNRFRTMIKHDCKSNHLIVIRGPVLNYLQIKNKRNIWYTPSLRPWSNSKNIQTLGPPICVFLGFQCAKKKHAINLPRQPQQHDKPMVLCAQKLCTIPPPDKTNKNMIHDKLCILDT